MARNSGMRKATQSAGAVSLGTKRTCPKCATKFYDFNKDELACPKCEKHFKVSELTGHPFKEAREKKAPKKELPEEALMDSEDIVVGENADNFESVEDIDDDEDEVVEDIKVDGDDEDF
jgi:uncharacterized protein (TIGR02300 family)